MFFYHKINYLNSIYLKFSYKEAEDDDSNLDDYNEDTENNGEKIYINISKKHIFK